MSRHSRKFQYYAPTHLEYRCLKALLKGPLTASSIGRAMWPNLGRPVKPRRLDELPVGETWFHGACLGNRMTTKGYCMVSFLSIDGRQVKMYSITERGCYALMAYETPLANGKSPWKGQHDY